MSGETTNRRTTSLADEPKPRVSIGLPVYNGAPYLEQALDSLLSQTFGDFELIISDNASDDGTAEIAARYAQRDSRIRYHRNDENLGAARNFNNTFALSRGQYFKWAACDDIHLCDYLQRCVEALDENPDVVLAYPRAREISEDGRPLHESLDPLELSDPSPARRIHHMLWASRKVHMVFGLMRREVLAQTDLLLAENGADRLLLTKLAIMGPWRQVDEILFVNRATGSRRNARTRRFHDPNLHGYAPFRRVWLRCRQAGVIWRSSIPAYQKPLLVCDTFACYLARDLAPLIRRRTARLFQYYPGAMMRRARRLLTRFASRQET
ncbi:MAG: glycosyltransferase family 2 protein [Thermoleophilia bacterium]|nr:glycosyltransferase family 2 protein [Thermoleophilia bacterium]